MPEIQLAAVSKYYEQDKKRIAAVEDVNLSVKQGEFVFVTGSSGAGKTTLLKLISGEISPDYGTVYLNGAPMNGFSRRIWQRKHCFFGRVPQLSQLVKQRTIQENLTAIAMVRDGRAIGSVQQRVQKVLAMVGLSGVEERYPLELSLGECRRIELAGAIINSPAILVLDELTANLDEDTTWDVFHLLEEMNHRGTTVIMATHAKAFVNMLRKRVITLMGGHIVGDVEKGRYGDISLTKRSDS